MIKDKHYTCITGASSGIGEAVARAFAKRGHHLILTARRQERLESLRAELVEEHPQLDIVLKVFDLADSQQVYDFYHSLKDYHISTWVNNAGFGNYSSVAQQDLSKISQMISLNIEALTILSSLYAHDYQDTKDSQLINLSSRGGYMLVPNAVTYCATKYYVSAFTEGLALELKRQNANLQAKVLAPAATKTEFGQVATDNQNYNYDQAFSQYHSSEQMANFLLKLYDSDEIVGLVDVTDFSFHLSGPLFKY
ncbi:SDR family NAD(P)-dependent oxidoreductase [Streptococcus dentapri]|uniref:SDR family NAD(P)-dependent oxidoreductase n=1 Tax=Streptococcus dentapri TaxID=573564 RepID=A0ABV8CZF5_9STRE